MILIAKGILEGAIEAEGFEGIEECIHDAQSVITDTETAVSDFK